MNALLRSVALWATLAATAWLLVESETSAIGIMAGVFRLLSLTVAVILTWGAVAALSPSRFWRLSFWVVTVAGWLAVGLLVAGRFQGQAHFDDRQLLALATLCALLVAIWLALRTKGAPIRCALEDAIAGSVIVALVAGVFCWLYEAKTDSLTARAEMRWTEIGLPMSEFESSLAPVSENSGTRVVRQAFREILAQGFYKHGTAAAIGERVIPRSGEASNLVTHACDIISAKLPPSDDLDLSNLPVSSLESHADELEDIYRQILAAETPVWACNPLQGPGISVPNFLGIRMFSQLASAESLRRLASADEEGAARALAACEKLGANLERNPSVVALMIHVAVDALVATRQARLPASDDRLETIARDAARWRDSLVRSLQWESWLMLRRAGEVAHEYAASETQDRAEQTRWFRYLPESIRPFTEEIYMRRQCAIGAFNDAEHAAICRSPRIRTLPDFGAGLHEAVSQKNPSICELNVSRAVMRIHATLLLREQAELIRNARARLAAGEQVSSRDSAILPGAYWECTADPLKRTVSLRLHNAPNWIYEGGVTGDGFWLLPLDGSVAWQFRVRPKSTAAL